MNTFYGENPSLSSPNRVQNPSSLGIFTKTHVKLKPQGLQRLHDFILQDQSAKLLPKERVCNCLKKRINKDKLREVKYNENRRKAHWSNVQRCGSIWSCPVCAKQITEKRREELKQAVSTWQIRHEGSIQLLTLTFSHSCLESLKSLLERQKKAYKIFLQMTKVQAIFKKMGVVHKIRSFEVTYGDNGWHPHFHILMFNKYIFVSVDLKKSLSELWIKSCVRAGLSAPSMQHGLDIRDGKYASQYVSKWGLEHEMTKGHLKRGKKNSVTPFDLLHLSFENEEIFNKKPSKLFQEFAISVKGFRQLVWSRGLKKLLEIEEKSDEELAEETENDAISLRTVDSYIFSLLCHYQKRHHFLKALEDDYENGCFGTGSAENLLIEILKLETTRLNEAA